MADIVDITAERAEKEDAYLVAACKRPAGPLAKGSCYYCDERVPEPMRWCDAECRTAWQDEERVRGLQ